VLAATIIEGRDPTEPVDLVVEILSDDQFRYIHDKCRHYLRVGIAAVFVIDPDERRLWRWDPGTETLTPIDELQLPNGRVIVSVTIWSAFDERTAVRDRSL